MSWSLPILLDELNAEVTADLQRARKTLGHPTDMGDASEEIWIELFNKYLPKRYHAIKATVVDSTGAFSEQIDVVIHDRQYTPLVFTFKDKHVVPAESVYAVFESKQEMNSAHDLSPKSPPVLRRVLELMFGLKRPVFPVPDCWRIRWA